MAARFYLPGFDGDASEATLPAEESHHLAHVMRLAPGAEVRVFNGHGGEWVATVSGIARTGATLRIGEPVQAAPECAVSIVLGQALLKGDHVDAVIRDATMLGAAAVWPLRTAHTVVSRRAGDAREVARWQRVAVASAKQCGRAVVPVIRPVSPAEVAFGAEPNGVRLLLVEPAAGVAAVSRVEPLAEQARRHGVLVLVGPEGGWHADEVARATTAGFVPWRLGTITLRADAVAVPALAVLRYAWGV